MTLVPQQQSRDIYVNPKQKGGSKKGSVKCGLEDVTRIHVLSSAGKIKQIATPFCSLFFTTGWPFH
jgi:hypothetical protein